MALITPATAAAAITVAWLTTMLVRRLLRPAKVRYSANPPLPPGPKGLPLIGNLRDLPPAGTQPYRFWLPHKDLYGPISSVSALGMTIVILHDPAVAAELYEKRGAKYSSRPRFTFAMEMCGYDGGTLGQPYGSVLRAHRKYMHSSLGTPAALERYAAYSAVEVRRLLLRTSKDPARLHEHIKRLAGAIIVKIAYGYTVDPHQPDPLVELAQKSMNLFVEAARVGRWMVDIVPSLKHVPDFFPGTGFKQFAREIHAVNTRVVEDSFNFVKRRMAAGDYEQSYVSDAYERLGKNETITREQEDMVKHSAVTLYGAGSDTTVSVLYFFFLNMMLHPEIQRRAQAEIEEVMGPCTIPTLADRASLPYVNAIVTETLRWHPVVAMVTPHVTTEDDVYDGYLIPKGALVTSNIWWFTHNPDVYPEPERFNPDRWLVEDDSQMPPDPRGYVFGFGRRFCPGRVLADQTIFSAIAATLTVFDIRKPVDPATGKVIEPNMDLATTNVAAMKEEYLADIRPRSVKHADLIASVEVEHPWEEGSARLMEDDFYTK